MKNLLLLLLLKNHFSLYTLLDVSAMVLWRLKKFFRAAYWFFTVSSLNRLKWTPEGSLWDRICKKVLLTSLLRTLLSFLKALTKAFVLFCFFVCFSSLKHRKIDGSLKDSRVRGSSGWKTLSGCNWNLLFIYLFFLDMSVGNAVTPACSGQRRSRLL